MIRVTRVEICLLLCKNWLSGGVDPEEKGGAVQGPFRPRRQSIGPQTMGKTNVRVSVEGLSQTYAKKKVHQRVLFTQRFYGFWKEKELDLYL